MRVPVRVETYCDGCGAPATVTGRAWRRHRCQDCDRLLAHWREHAEPRVAAFVRAHDEAV